MGDMNRNVFLSGVIAACALPSAVRAADAAGKRFHCRARLHHVLTNKTWRTIDVDVVAGKKTPSLDGVWDTTRLPRRPIGLLVTFTVRDGSPATLAFEAEYGKSTDLGNGGQSYNVTDSKMSGEDEFPPGAERAYPWKIVGDDFLLFVSVDPLNATALPAPSPSPSPKP